MHAVDSVMPRMIDIHGHVQFEAFENDWKEVMDRSLAGNCWVVIPSTQLATATRALEIAHQYPSGVFAAIGFHPTHVEGPRGNVFLVEDFDALAQDAAVVAIGECGLDYFRMDQSRRGELMVLQKKVLWQQIELATLRCLPMIVHCRDAYDDLITMLSDAVARGMLERRGVIHCYLSDWKHAEAFLDLGFSLSFTGIITFTDDEALLDVVRKVPVDRFCIETDAPYLSPVPQRGKRNEPLNVEFIAEFVAALRGMSPEDVLSATLGNARKIFRI